jgi:hypothetical protein
MQQQQNNTYNYVSTQSKYKHHRQSLTSGISTISLKKNAIYPDQKKNDLKHYSDPGCEEHTTKFDD